MRNVLIITHRKDFHHAIARGEELPHGIAIQPKIRETWMDGTDHHFQVKVNLRAISGTAFALWILRKLRSVGGDHQLVIDGRGYSLQMPQAIDEVADAVVNLKRSKLRLAA